MDIPRERICAILDGVDTETFRPPQDGAKEPNSLLFVGNSEDRNKGALYLIEALALLQDEVPLSLTLVDREEKDLKVVPPLVRKYGLKNRVTYTGRISSEELVRLYGRSQLLVSPSLYEGFGLPAAEAMACGLPVVATSAGAFPEVIEDGVTGRLVPPADARALAGAIRELMADGELRRRMGEAGRRRVEERFTWRETARRTVQLYEEVLGCPRAEEPGSATPAAVPRRRWRRRTRGRV
jgi:glycosyltransferase involved in cell wall biosynthesis